MRRDSELLRNACRRLQPQFTAQLRDRSLLQQMPPQNGDMACSA